MLSHENGWTAKHGGIPIRRNWAWSISPIMPPHHQLHVHSAATNWPGKPGDRWIQNESSWAGRASGIRWHKHDSILWDLQCLLCFVYFFGTWPDDTGWKDMVGSRTSWIHLFGWYLNHFCDHCIRGRCLEPTKKENGISMILHVPGLQFCMEGLKKNAWLVSWANSYVFHVASPPPAANPLSVNCAKLPERRQKKHRKRKGHVARRGTVRSIATYRCPYLFLRGILPVKYFDGHYVNGHTYFIPVV